MEKIKCWFFNQPAPNELIDIADCFAHCEYKTWLVGGAIRSILLDKEPHDWDMCTDATPDEIIRVAGENGMDTIPTGIQHGTVTIVINDKQFECTTLRLDGNYSDNRRPDSVEFTNKIKEDLARRDFTINAMAIDLNQEKLIVDPFNGESDIKNKLIRCVGNPCDRFNEDALRILRALRFSAQLAFDIEPETSKAIHDCKHLLSNVSKERIRDELCKILLSDGCGNRVIKEYSDVFKYIIPGLDDSKSLEKFSYTFRYMRGFNKCTVNDNNELIIRLALSLWNTEDDFEHVYEAKNTYKILRDLKFSNEVVAKVTQLVSYRNINLRDNKKQIKRLLNKLGKSQFENFCTVYFAEHKLLSAPPHIYGRYRDVIDVYDEIIANNECYSLKQLAVNGDDLINLGIPQGKQIKYVLNILLNMVIDEYVENDRDKLLGVAKSIMAADTPLTKGE